MEIIINYQKMTFSIITLLSRDVILLSDFWLGLKGLYIDSLTLNFA